MAVLSTQWMVRLLAEKSRKDLKWSVWKDEKQSK